jgi:hypothetical protein
MSDPIARLRGFISYAHEDAEHFASLRKHLAPVERLVKLSFWTDVELRGGQTWNERIADAIEAADTFILLMSHNSIASEYIFNRELPAIQRAVVDRGALAVPVVLEPCFWQVVTGALQAVPTGADVRVHPILRWKPRHDGFHRAAEQILLAIRAHFGLAEAPMFRWERAQESP